jgi:hypothetical protein
MSTISTLIRQIFSKPLTKFIRLSLENSRLNPAIGEILESFGVIGSTDSTGRCWTMLPSTAIAIRNRKGTATASAIAGPTLR